MVIIFQHMVRKTSEEPPSKIKSEIIKEAKRIEESTLYSSRKHFIMADFWSAFHLILGIPVVVLSAVAGLSIFSQFDNSKIISGLITIIVTGLSSLMTFLNTSEKSNAHLNCGHSYEALNTKVRNFRTINCLIEKSEEILSEKIKYYSEQKDKLNNTSPQPPWFAYYFAKKGIERGEASYSVDKESAE